MEEDLDPMEFFERQRHVKAAFSPTAPISKRDLFAGRTKQMISLVDGVDEPGQHLVLFGERGVGKTSLATVSGEILAAGGALSVRVNCQSNDTFSDVWRRAFNDINLTQTMQGAGFGSEVRSTIVPLPEALALPDQITADHVRAALIMLTRDRQVVIFFDEFDRMEGADIHREFADTIKTLSDQIIPATVVIVGVADNVDELISEHASVERALAQINMPRMSEEELSEIIDRGLTSVGMEISTSARGRITKLSQGLPHYTHLLAQQAALNATDGNRTRVVNEDVDAAVARGMAKTQESISSLYYRATYSARENLYKQVLLACASATADDRGFFSASGVREPLSQILGRKMEIPQFAMHLNAFSSDRGPVLKKEGVQRKFRYRFTNPLLQPYVLMRGLTDGIIDASVLDK